MEYKDMFVFAGGFVWIVLILFEHYFFRKQRKEIKELIEEAKRAIELEQDPVAWFNYDSEDGAEWKHLCDTREDAARYGKIAVPLYTRITSI